MVSGLFLCDKIRMTDYRDDKREFINDFEIITVYGRRKDDTD